jgi:hypothetical protein
VIVLIGLRDPLRRGISRTGEQLLASEEELFSVN